MKIPGEIRAGDSATWRDCSARDNLGNAVTSAAWTLKYALRQGSVLLTLTASSYQDGWQTTISKAQSAGFAAGVVFWQAYVEDTNSNRITLGSGQTKFLPSIAESDSSFDGRSQAQQDLDAVEAAIRALITGGAKAYTIGGRSVTKNDMAELLVWRDRCQAKVAIEKKAESIKNGLGNPSNVFVRFRK